ncbi:MAG: hypothetical protein Q9165_008142 [Trypethelium subeluteriae]
MATPQIVTLNPGELLELSVPRLHLDAAQKASELLSENHEKFHIFFNQSGFHNHIVHHLLTVYALGAPPSTIEKMYRDNTNYQRNMMQSDIAVVRELYDAGNWKKYLADEKHYHDFLTFFQQEIDEKGWEQTMQDYLFAHDERFDDLLVRMFAEQLKFLRGFLHPLIHLGFGVEFKQPAIIAEALAQAAVHQNWISQLLLGVEKAAKANRDKQSKSIVQLLDEIRADKDLRAAPHFDDGNLVRDGILKRAPEKMIHYASQFTVQPDELDEKTAEMTNAIAYFTGGAQHPPKQIKFDFYFIHCLNCTIFVPAFMKQKWLAKEDKARLLEWFVWLSLAMYASRKSPEPLMDEIRNYIPKQPANNWDSIFERARVHEDEGHAAKLIRALAHGQVISAPYEQNDTFKIKGDMWLQLGHMAIDSVEAGGNRWVRSAGFDEAWESFGPRAQL